MSSDEELAEQRRQTALREAEAKRLLAEAAARLQAEELERRRAARDAQQGS